MKKLGKRLMCLDAAASSRPVRVVRMEAGKTEEGAVAAYDRIRIDAGDKIMCFSFEGGCDAIA